MEMLGSSGPLAGICKSLLFYVCYSLGMFSFVAHHYLLNLWLPCIKDCGNYIRLKGIWSINTFFCRTQLHLLQVTAAIQWFMLTVLCLEIALWFQEKQKSAPLMLLKVCLQLYFQCLNWIFLSNCFFCKYLNKFTVKALKSFNIKGVWPLQTVCMV